MIPTPATTLALTAPGASLHEPETQVPDLLGALPEPGNRLPFADFLAEKLQFIDSAGEPAKPLPTDPLAMIDTPPKPDVQVAAKRNAHKCGNGAGKTLPPVPAALAGSSAATPEPEIRVRPAESIGPHLETAPLAVGVLPASLATIIPPTLVPVMATPSGSAEPGGSAQPASPELKTRQLSQSDAKEHNLGAPPLTVAPTVTVWRLPVALAAVGNSLPLPPLELSPVLQAAAAVGPALQLSNLPLTATTAVIDLPVLAGLPEHNQASTLRGAAKPVLAPELANLVEQANEHSTRTASAAATGDSAQQFRPELPQPIPASWTSEMAVVEERSPGVPSISNLAASQPARQDFAGLIDRLFAAREAAEATLAPHNVQAAIAHSDFGKVSLQFQQDMGGMTVTLANSDPDFVRAVQAATSPAQGDFGNESETSSRRSDPQPQQSGGQPSSGAASAQSQGQQRGHHPPRFAADARPGANPSPPRGHHDEPAVRAGIFA